MKVKQIQIINYKSWKDSGVVELKDGINVVVGQNNAGKTAFLEALSFNKSGIPHKTIESKPHSDSNINPNSIINATFEFDQDELYKASLSLAGDFFVPLTSDNILPVDAIKIINEKLTHAQSINSEFINNIVTKAEFNSDWYSPYRSVLRCRATNDRRSIEIYNVQIVHESSAGSNLLPSMLIVSLKRRVYLLRAERFNIDQAPVQSDNELLEQNCSNLAQVLHSLLSSNSERFNRIVELLKKVFPKIKGVSVPVSNGIAKIAIWSVDPKSERKDLVVPLSESGTGIGQVLAMLYLIIHSDVSQCILIDEPQSFLHPGAIRSLVDILYSHKRHQYVITTHSPYILSIPTSSVIHITHNGLESKAQMIDGLEADDARLILRDIGFKVSDVFGADKILWVEGPTEEECFKLIVRTLMKDPLWGTEIIGVRTTGELHGKQAEDTYDIYTKLSQGIGIIPPAIGFIFDRELKTEIKMMDLIRKSKNKVFFLSRRMYENYLIDPDAISYVLYLISKSSESVMDANHFESENVREWILNHGNSKKYIKTMGLTPFDKEWLIQVDAAAVLADLFSQISGATISYDKVKHGYLLTKYIIERQPSAFEEIIGLLERVSNGQSKD